MKAFLRSITCIINVFSLRALDVIWAGCLLIRPSLTLAVGLGSTCCPELLLWLSRLLCRCISSHGQEPDAPMYLRLLAAHTSRQRFGSPRLSSSSTLLLLLICPLALQLLYWDSPLSSPAWWWGGVVWPAVYLGISPKKLPLLCYCLHPSVPQPVRTHSHPWAQCRPQALSSLMVCVTILCISIESFANCWMSDSDCITGDTSKGNEKSLDKWNSIMFNYLSMRGLIIGLPQCSSFSIFSYW